jgi:hypothetical protein
MKRRALFLFALLSIINLTVALPSLAASHKKIQAAQPPDLHGDQALAGAKFVADLNFGKTPLYFIPNQGQMDDRVAFYIQGKDKNLYFSPEGMTLSLNYPQEKSSGSGGGPEGKIESRFGAPKAAGRWNIRLEFVNPNPGVRPTGEDKTGALVSYFKGKPEEWRTGLSTYSRIIYRDLWPGIDLVYSGNMNQLKYEFIVRPGADPSRIRLRYRGADDVRIAESGQLEVGTPAGVFRDGVPVAYQNIEGKRRPVALAYSLQGSEESGIEKSTEKNAASPTVTYGFDVGGYDRTQTLVLDPIILVYCGFVGGSGLEVGMAIARDASGSAYITGYSGSSQATFPVAVGPDLTYNNGYDVFVAKVSATGGGLVYCGYIGGSGDDYGRGIAVDAFGNAYITGKTSSTESSFPAAVGPDLVYNGGGDAFVAKVNAAGTGLVYCGYIGGSGDEWGYGIGVDGAGNAYIAGDTNSTESGFPISVGPDLTYNGGSRDIFVAKVNGSGTALSYCGYIGGAYDEYGYGIAVDASGAAYVTGRVDSFDGSFPATVGPDLTFNGGSDAYVAKVNSAGTGLDYCGYIGGGDNDYGYGIAVDGAGCAYVTGYTYSYDGSFPAAVGPDLTFNGGAADAFVIKVNPGGTGFVYGGFIGGSGNEYGYAIAVDPAGEAYVVGTTSSTESTFPVCGGPDLSYNGGSQDGFIAKVKASGQGLLYCGYIGGTDTDYARGVAADGTSAYFVGETNSTGTGFPTVVGPGLTLSGNFDAFVAKVSGPSLWEPRHAVGDFDGDGTNELAVDFGATGVWMWNAGAWTQLSASNPESLVTVNVDGNSRDEIAADFGSLGLWLWNGGSWSQLSAVNPEGVAACDTDANGLEELVCDFGPAGVWLWTAGSWNQLSGVNADYVAANDFDGNGSDEIVGDFGAVGLWLWDHDTWTQLSGVNADYVTFADFSDDGVSESLVGDFGPTGLWKWTSGVWTELSGVNADYVMIANPYPAPGEEVVGDFGAIGMWIWGSGNWTILTGANPEYFIWTDIDGNWVDELAADFGSLGLWFWNAGAWTELSGVNPEYIMGADLDGDGNTEIVGDFGALGLWLWNAGVWTQISPKDPD